MSGRPRRKSSGGEHPPGSRFRLYVKILDDDGNPDLDECGWISVDPRMEKVREMSDAKIFTSREPGHGSAEDWARFFELEEPEWRISVSWIPEKRVRRSASGLSSAGSDSP